MSTPEQQYRKNFFKYKNQDKLISFFKGTDAICPELLIFYNAHLKLIFNNLSKAVPENFHHTNIAQLLKEKYEDLIRIDERNHKRKIDLFHNNGRRPEEVYYNWMRGFLICEFFKKAFAHIFKINESDLTDIGDDNNSQKNFKRTATADLEFSKDDKKFRLEIQSGFTGKNDIKETKINEALKRYSESEIITFVIHFDIFNGKAAIINIVQDIDQIKQWEKREAFENSIVYSIPKTKFTWNITEEPPVILQ